MFSLIDKGGETKYVSVSSSQVVPQTSAVQFVLVIDDISQSEKQRLQIERSSRLDALGQLTGGIAHDFNNILTAILYSIVLAGRTDDPKLRAEHLKEAEKSVGRAQLQTSRLMTFAGKQPGLAESKSVAEVFRSFESLVRPILEANFEFAVNDVDADVSVLCDAPQLESTLMNLVLNSRDAMIAAGRGYKISLMARVVDAAPEVSLGQTDRSEMGGYVEISVADNGPGMDHETQRRAADPFFTTKEEGSGTGLGLAMAYSFSRQSNGFFQIYSELGVGTTVQLTLPRGASVGPQKAQPDEFDIHNGAGETILLVEDHASILKTTTMFLEDIGYVVVGALSSRDALEIARAGPDFDLLLTDVVMPGGINGFELARRVKEMRPSVAVVYFSGYTGFDSAEMGEVTAPLLQKPASPVELSQAIALAIQKAK